MGTSCLVGWSEKVLTRLALLIVLALTGSPVFAEVCGGTVRCEVDGGYYLVAPPLGWDGFSPVPVVVYFHGWNSSPEATFRNRAMINSVTRRGAVFVVPYARTGYWRQIGPGRAEPGRDELAYVRAVMEDVAREWPVDTNRTLASGFSRRARLTIARASRSELLVTVQVLITMRSGEAPLSPWRWRLPSTPHRRMQSGRGQRMPRAHRPAL